MQSITRADFGTFHWLRDPTEAILPLWMSTPALSMDWAVGDGYTQGLKSLRENQALQLQPRKGQPAYSPRTESWVVFRERYRSRRDG